MSTFCSSWFSMEVPHPRTEQVWLHTWRGPSFFNKTGTDEWHRVKYRLSIPAPLQNNLGGVWKVKKKKKVQLSHDFCIRQLILRTTYFTLKSTRLHFEVALLHVGKLTSVWPLFYNCFCFYNCSPESLNSPLFNVARWTFCLITWTFDSFPQMTPERGCAAVSVTQRVSFRQSLSFSSSAVHLRSLCSKGVKAVVSNLLHLCSVVNMGVLSTLWPYRY